MRTLLALVALLAASSAHAITIKVEPDDFEYGVAIDTPYVDVFTQDRNGQRFAIYRSTSITPQNYEAPTGTSVFALDPQGRDTGVSWYPWSSSNYPAGIEGGLWFKFDRAIASLTIFQLDIDYGFLGAECVAWRREVEVGCRVLGSGAIGEAVLSSVSLGGSIDRIVFGGTDSISAIAFDRLEAVSVPLPSSAGLLLLGLAGMLVSRRRTLT